MNKGASTRNDRLIKEKRHDVYRSQQKLPESTRCPHCNAQIIEGHWSWPKPPKKFNEVVCPACQRIADNLPAGSIEIRGSFFKENRNEILNMIMNIEKAEKAEHPMERIMEITDEHDPVLLTTTGVHIARRIGEALSRSYNGELTIQYADEEQSVRIFWQR